MKTFLSLFLIIFANAFAEVTDIYLAGPLFTIAERDFNASLAERLRSFGHTVFLPQEQELREFTAKYIFAVDVGGVDQAKMVVAIMDGSDPDSGTCWECGYAFGKGKPIIAVRTDFRGICDGGLAPYNLMLWESAIEHIQVSSLQCDLPTLAEDIHKAILKVK